MGSRKVFIFHFSLPPVETIDNLNESSGLFCPAGTADDLAYINLPESSELVELDASELEYLLNTDQDSVYNNFNINNDANPFEETPSSYDFNVLPTYEEVFPQQETANEVFPQPAIANEVIDSHFTSGVLQEPEDVNSYLVIAVPEPLQEAVVFNRFPTVPLSSIVVEKINQVSSESDGAFLRLGKSTTNRILSPVRRAPLQVIQQIVNSSAPKPILPKPPVFSCKRKQRFELSREDGITFVDEALPALPQSPVKRERRALKPFRDQSFVWSLATPEEANRPQEVVDETKRCPGCNKIFKKLSFHKCKKLQPATENLKCSTCKKTFSNSSELNAHKEIHANVCVGCKDEFKTKRALSIHTKKCAADESSTDSSQSQESSNSKGRRQTRSSHQKQD